MLFNNIGKIITILFCDDHSLEGLLKYDSESNLFYILHNGFHRRGSLFVELHNNTAYKYSWVFASIRNTTLSECCIKRIEVKEFIGEL